MAIAALKGLAIIGVVIVHLPATGRFSQDTWNTVLWAQAAFEWCVIGFFFASGFVSSLSANAQPSGFRQFLNKRFSRLLIPYFCFSLFYKSSMIGLATAGLVQSAQPKLPLDFFGWLDFFLLPANPQIYFLLVLFFIQIAGFWISHRTVSRFTPVLIALAFVLPWFALSNQPLHGFRLELFPFYLGSYLLGGFISLAKPRVSLILIIALSLALLVPILKGGQHFRPLWLVFPPLLCICLRYPPLHRLQSFLAGVGKFAGPIYVWHAPLVISAATLTTIFMLGNGALSAVLVVILTVALSILTGTMVNRVSSLRPFHFK